MLYSETMDVCSEIQTKRKCNVRVERRTFELWTLCGKYKSIRLWVAPAARPLNTGGATVSIAGGYTYIRLSTYNI
jgi:hypothetical protein